MTRAFRGRVKFLYVKMHIRGVRAHDEGEVILRVSTSIHSALALKLIHQIKAQTEINFHLKYE